MLQIFLVLEENNINKEVKLLFALTIYNVSIVKSSIQNSLTNIL